MAIVKDLTHADQVLCPFTANADGLLMRCTEMCKCWDAKDQSCMRVLLMKIEIGKATGEI